MEKIDINKHMRRFEKPDPTKPKKRGGINGPHTLAVHDLMVFMGEDPKDSKRFAYWCGQLRNAAMTPAKVRDDIKKAKGGKWPQKLFNHLLKVRREAIKKSKNEKNKK